MCHISNIWRTQYGYDQRIEVFGSKGMLRAENRPETSVMHFREDGILLDRLIPSSEEDWASDDFFMPKYAAAYPHEMNLFVDAVLSGEPPLVTIYDGYRAQMIVEAAVKSLATNQPVQIEKD
jgi:myo-inositol 2-dehydrogenase/D-chiro-inositol 1-dehydrogenase